MPTAKIVEMTTPAASQAQRDVAANLEIFDAVRFDGMDDLFRVRVATTQQNAGFVWAESRTTHKQWQLDTEDFGHHSPEGFMYPADRVIKLLKKGLATAVASSGGKEATPAAGVARGEAGVVLVVTGRMSQDKLELSLNLSIGDVDDEPQIFRFLLAYKEVTKLEELESKLCDAVEKIRELEAHAAASAAAAAVPKKTSAFVSLSAASATANGQAVTWNGQSTGPAVRAITASHFTISADNQSVTVLHRGLYHIHVRLDYTSGGIAFALTLRVNGADLAKCTQLGMSGCQNSAQITEITMLEAGSVLSVVCGANYNSSGDVLETRFSVFLLQPLDE